MVSHRLDLPITGVSPAGTSDLWPLRRRVDVRRAVLGGAALTAFALASIEGYLIALHPQLGKLTGVLLVGTWLLLRWRVSPAPQMHAIHVVLAALGAVVLVSTTVHLGAPFTIDYTIRWLPFVVVTAVIVDIASAVIGIRRLLAAALIGATAAACGALFSFLVLHEPRASGPLDDPNDLAYVLVAALPLIVAFSPRSTVARVCLIGSASIIAVAVATTFSRGGLIALAVALVWMMMRRAVSGKLVCSALAAVSAAGFAIAMAAEPLVSKALSEKTYIAGENIDTRLLRWQAAARMLADAPLFGVGPGGFREHYAAVSWLAEMAEPTAVAHNMSLEVGAELGILGLIVFIAMIVTAFVSSENALRQGAERSLVVAIQASLLAIVVASVFLSEQYYFPLWSMVAIACAISLRAGRAAQR
jgi:O-antigen ligase